ncbi:hypothetical protein CMUC_1538 [Campylobacter mucosalis CCUG 21559]|uniref:HDOD domain-containing protein n=2 Tax=Campylobacter mucosalis TaxID=202 RepID=A0A6G5QI92_9BACT|nr:hypothetical protein CMUC_1538 [Campylobacter mucosalis CCUG 21559]
MLSKSQIDKIIEHIGFVPENIKQVKALMSAKKPKEAIGLLALDREFVIYFLTMLRNADFYVDIGSKDVRIIAEQLDVNLLNSIIDSYALFLKFPKKCEIFDISTIKLVELNAKILCHWDKILTQIRYRSARNSSLASLMMLNILLAELVFVSFVNSVDGILDICDISYDEIFEKMYSQGLFFTTALMLDFNLKTLPPSEKNIVEYFKILICYEISQPGFCSAGFDKIFNLSAVADTQMLVEFKRALVR